MIDLRSDTFTLPTADLRAAMANADVGDDVFGEDPTVRQLEERAAEVLGKSAAVFMPSGTMSNQVGLRVLTNPGDQVLIEASSHMMVLEGAAPAMLSSVSMRQLPGTGGVLEADQIRAAIPVPHPFMVDTVLPPTTTLCLENTHNLAGGTVWPIDTLAATAAEAKRHGLHMHLDGARLWNAAVQSGRSEADFAQYFDTVSVCFSKGLGAPVGSALAGSAELMKQARRFRQSFGGGMRQSGMVAAGALFALENHRERLAEDHANATRLAAGLAELNSVSLDPDTVQTNIVRFEVTSMTAGEFTTRCHAEGVHMIPGGPHGVRAVTRMGISQQDVDDALQVFARVLGDGG